MKKYFYAALLIYSALFPAIEGIGAQEYIGEVVPTATSTYAYVTFTDIYGNYAYIARPGEIIKPEVKDTEGKVTQKGTMLLQMDLRYWNAVLDQQKAILDQSIENLNLAKIEAQRCKKLYETRAGSLDQYQKAENTYYNAVITHANAEAAYKQYKFQIDCYTDIAPWEGIVTKNFTVIGPTTGGAPAVAVSQLNPIGVKIKLTRDAAKAIANNTPVKIYPVNSNNPQGIIYGRSVLTDDGIEFITENYPIVEGTTIIENSKYPVIRSWYPVLKFYVDKNPEVLSVAERSIQQENGKFYVWKAKGQKTMQPDKVIDKYFEIEKVYIEPDDKMKNVDNYWRKVALKDKGNLELYDLVISEPPENLTEGEKVMYPEGNYLLMPGDKVKVVVGN